MCEKNKLYPERVRDCYQCGTPVLTRHRNDYVFCDECRSERIRERDRKRRARNVADNLEKLVAQLRADGPSTCTNCEMLEYCQAIVKDITIDLPCQADDWYQQPSKSKSWMQTLEMASSLERTLP